MERRELAAGRLVRTLAQAGAPGAYPRLLEDWDMDRIARDYGDAAGRMQAAGLDGFELEC